MLSMGMLGHYNFKAADERVKALSQRVHGSCPATNRAPTSPNIRRSICSSTREKDKVMIRKISGEGRSISPFDGVSR